MDRHRRTMRPRSPSLLLASCALALACTVCQRQTGEATATENEPLTHDDTEGTGAGTEPGGAAAADGVRVRPSALAGGWYPADRDALHAEVLGYLHEAAAYDGARPMALISPHAGYRYSGPTAGQSYRAIERERYDRVFILGPSHHVAFHGLAVGGWSHYETPLGRVPIDTAAVERLVQDDLFAVAPGVDGEEHSLEIQVPFVQVAAMGSSLVPLVVGDLDAGEASRAADALRAEIGPGDLVVISTDFCHYGARFGFQPDLDDVPAGLRDLDMGAFEAVASLDPAQVLDYRQRTGVTVCGIRPLAILAALLPRDAELTLRRYTTSGEITGDWGSTVSYVSAVATGSPWSGRGADSTTWRLSRAEQRTLLTLARDAIEARLHGQPPPNLDDYAITDVMREPSGAFVTLTIDGRLRGCIGEIPPERPLAQTVRDRAVDAAFGDPRFTPLTARELAEVHIEISALTPPAAVDGYDDIVLGRDGIYLIKGLHRAVFLPQVAVEQGWDLDETLTHLASKAGLPPNAWQEGASFEVFQAQVFHE